MVVGLLGLFGQTVPKVVVKESKIEQESAQIHLQVMEDQNVWEIMRRTKIVIWKNVPVINYCT